MRNKIVAEASLYRVAGFVFFFLVFLYRSLGVGVPGWAIGTSALLAGIGLLFDI